MAILLGLVFLNQGLVTNLPGQGQEEKVSRFNEYQGYSKPLYDGWMRSSQYVTVRDGTKIAIDILRPTKNGEVVEDPLPVIWTHCRYHRASVVEGKLRTMVNWLGARLNIPLLISHGYVVAAADTRGGGASFGIQRGFFAPEEAKDAYDITEWLAAQSWSDGNIGMYGRSYLGITQYFAASENPPHLKAIFPEMAYFDVYDFVYPGGIYRHDFIDSWNRLTQTLDASLSTALGNFKLGPAAPVDEDAEGRLRDAAVKEHEANWDMVDFLSPLHFRNSVHAGSQKMIWPERSPASRIEEIRKSGIPIYHLVGWFDMFPRDTVLYYKNLDIPQKVVIGPWFHGQSQNFDLPVEHLRWYDYWLKGIDNGIMDEKPFVYWTIGAPEGEEWRSTREWPLPQQKPTPFYFHQGPSGSIPSVNDGVLSTSSPKAKGKDDYTTDYTTTIGKGNRWANGYGGPIGYPDLSPNDKKGLTYTTAPLEEDVEITGHPVVHLWITSTADDGDFFVYLEEINAAGKSIYATEGALRASHRSIADPPYDYLGLPYHRSFEEDIEPLPDEPVELAFDLHPISQIFHAGNRIRVTITCADTDSTQTPVLTPPPTVSIHRAEPHASHIILPIISTTPEEKDTLPIRTIVIAAAIVLVLLIIVILIKRKKRTAA
jgi:putative CocE/NonD family hydrolase